MDLWPLASETIFLEPNADVPHFRRKGQDITCIDIFFFERKQHGFSKRKTEVLIIGNWSKTRGHYLY